MVDNNEKYTLIIPTFNRPAELTALLGFLNRQGAKFPTLILDSSREENRELNRKAADESWDQVQYREYDESTHPFDKFKDGVAHARTEFCQLCADDDLILLDGIRDCVSAMERRSDIVVAHGYYFMFLDSGRKGIDLPSVLYFSPDNLSSDPCLRLRELFRNYQALTYGVYRREALADIFAKVSGVKSLLARELLSGGLTVAKGGAMRIKRFTHGRSLSPSTEYEHWHPLEWMIRSPEKLLKEYSKYRSLLVEEIVENAETTESRTEVQRKIDLIHFLYLVRHAPERTVDFIVDKAIKGEKFMSIWKADEVQVPLTQTGYLYGGPATQIKNIRNLAKDLIWEVGRYGKRAVGRFGIKIQNPVHETIVTGTREYRIHPKFFNPQPGYSLTFGQAELSELLRELDLFKLNDEGPRH